MIEKVSVQQAPSLAHYERDPVLSQKVAELQGRSRELVAKLAGRRLWMVNSTAQGGGVAEMMPTLLSLLREVGLEVEWLVIGTERTPFFDLTKRLHNLIHGAGEPRISAEDRALYDLVSQELAAELEKIVTGDDLLIVHDPQPAGMGALVKERLKLHAVWRCHIGLDHQCPQTTTAWNFLRDFLKPYDHSIFTAPEYIPSYLRDRASIIHPALDPLSAKNVELKPSKLVQILCNSRLMRGDPGGAAFQTVAQRLQPDGTFQDAHLPEDIGLLFRPIVTQISRWDKLKGWEALLEGFVSLKRGLDKGNGDHGQTRLAATRLVLAGPEPAAVQDDPEAKEVLESLIRLYCKLPRALQDDVVLLSLR